MGEGKRVFINEKVEREIGEREKKMTTKVKFFGRERKVGFFFKRERERWSDRSGQSIIGFLFCANRTRPTSKFSSGSA